MQCYNSNADNYSMHAFSCHAVSQCCMVYLNHTIVAQDDMKICREEIFGPVMSVIKFRTEEEVWH